MKAKERPILFSAPMVQAILDGRKAMTRRICKCENTIKAAESFCDVLHDGKGAIRLSENKIGPRPIGYICHTNEGPDIDDCIKMFSPYGVPGDRLWVRETWAAFDDQAIKDRDKSRVFYRADDGVNYPTDGKWKPSIFMPRWASRILLEVTEVRIERLQDISEADAKAEGAPVADIVSGRALLDQRSNQGCYRWGFRLLWDSINGPGAWDSNPWVWVISFRRIEQ